MIEAIKILKLKFIWLLEYFLVSFFFYKYIDILNLHRLKTIQNPASNRSQIKLKLAKIISVFFKRNK